jgi:hypothetical protein
MHSLIITPALIALHLYPHSLDRMADAIQSVELPAIVSTETTGSVPADDCFPIELRCFNGETK